MRYITLIWAGLAHGPVRTVLTMLCIVVAFFLFVVLHALTSMLHGASDNASTARLIVTSRDGVYSPLPAALRSQIEDIEGVSLVDVNTILPAYFRERKNIVGVVALDAATTFAMFDEWHVSPEHLDEMKARRTGALADEDLARRNGWSPGDDIPLQAFSHTKADGSLDWTFKLVGTYRSDSAQPPNALLINYVYFDEERSSGKGTVNSFSVAVRDATQLSAIAMTIDDLFSNSANPTLTQSERQFTEALINQLGDIDFVVTAVLGAVLATLIVVIVTTMIQSMDERIAEVGVLKTLGFTDAGVFGLLVGESAVLCMTGAVVGIGAASLALPLVQGLTGADRPPAVTLATAVGLGLLLSALTGLIPAVRAARLNVVDALATK